MKITTSGASTILGIGIFGAALFSSAQAAAYNNASETIVSSNDYQSSCGSGCYKKSDCAGTSTTCKVSYDVSLWPQAGGGSYLLVTGDSDVANYWLYLQVYCSSSGWQSSGWYGPYQGACQ